jgi:hypothetical protein
VLDVGALRITVEANADGRLDVRVDSLVPP